MRLTASTANGQGVTLSVSKLSDGINNCNKVIGKSLFSLYDKGYLPSPTVFDEKSAKRALIQEFPKDINYLCSNIDGNLNLTSLRIKFASKVTENDSFREVTSVLYDYYKSVEDLDALEKTLANIIVKKTDLVTVNPKISVSESVINYRCPLRFDNEAVRQCLQVDSKFELTSYDLSFLVLKSLCNTLSIPSSVYEECKESNKAIFIEGLTYAEELEFIPLLTSGELHLPTKYGKVLSDGVLEYYKTIRDESSVIYGRITFDAGVYIDSFKERMAYIESVRDSLRFKSGSSYMLSQDSIIFKSANIHSTANIFSPSWSVVGNYVIDWSTHNELSKANNLLGISGEFVAEDYLRSLNFTKTGIPTMLKVFTVSNGELVVSEKAYYNINQLAMRDGTKLKALMGTEYEFVFTDISEVHSKYGVSDNTEFFNLLKSKATTRLAVSCSADYFSSLVADLTQSLIMMDCGYPDYTPVFTDKSELTQDLFYKACYTAELLFRELGF